METIYDRVEKEQNERCQNPYSEARAQDEKNRERLRIAKKRLRIKLLFHIGAFQNDYVIIPTPRIHHGPGSSHKFLLKTLVSLTQRSVITHWHFYLNDLIRLNWDGLF